MNSDLPRVLIIDDTFGRQIPGKPNREREHLCGKFLLVDPSGLGDGNDGPEVVRPIAEATFFRGQRPILASVGSVVENDLEGSLMEVRKGWFAAMEKGQPPWAMVLLDLCFYTGAVTEDSERRMPGMPEGEPGDDDPRSYFGLRLLDTIQHEFPELPVFILSSKPREDVSLEFSRRGALGFIARDDVSGPELLEEALWHHGLITDPAGEVVGCSLPILLALREGRRAGRHRENVLIRGERGSGKELFASYIHRMSSPDNTTKDRPYVVVNSAVFTPSLFASEFFGIQARTATGVDGKIGLIESANKGDLFLDEIGDMPSEVQAALLRVLQERRVTRVGARDGAEVDVRFLSATNANLEDAPTGFRSDLLDRLCIGGMVWLPPLRERPNDIPLLVERFTREAEAQRKGVIRREVTPEAMETLRGYEWPGNVRELRSVIFDAVNRFPDVEHLVPAHLRVRSSQSARTAGRQSVTHSAESSKVRGKELLALLQTMRDFEFKEDCPTAWVGQLQEVQSAYGRLMSRYLRAALMATRKPTPDNPVGEILIHPAMKLLTGDRELSASKAADLIKRLLNLSPDDKDALLGDPVLHEAYKIATRLRPTTNRRAAGPVSHQT